MNSIAKIPRNEIITTPLYDAMCLAIKEAFRVDEVKAIRDKALAMEVYSQQARAVENEIVASKIRVRAEHKAGRLLRETERAKGAQGNPRGQGGKIEVSQTATAQTLDELGISRSQSSRWQKLAEIPDDELEKHLNDKEVKASTSALLRGMDENGNMPEVPPVVDLDAPKVTWLPDNRSPTKQDNAALMLWGGMLELEKRIMSKYSFTELYAVMHPLQQQDMRRLLPEIIDFLGGINDCTG
jgi:hypothetical protein